MTKLLQQGIVKRKTDTSAKHKPKSAGFIKGVKKFFEDLSS